MIPNDREPPRLGRPGEERVDLSATPTIGKPLHELKVLNDRQPIVGTVGQTKLAHATLERSPKLERSHVPKSMSNFGSPARPSR